jgi:FkbM family methyltransferase
MSFVLHTLKPGDLFVDVGANIGSYSILAGACEGVKVVAFEPVPQTFSWLQKNIKINALENQIEVMKIGLAEQKGSINFSSNFDVLNHVVLQEKHNTSVVKVDVSKLDDILDHKYPTVIKIDVEGYELQVLNGVKKILDNPSLIAVIVELNSAGKIYGVDDEEIHKLLLSKKFETFKYNPLKRQLISLNGKYSSVNNTLYLRKLNEFKQNISKKSIFILGNRKKI